MFYYVFQRGSCWGTKTLGLCSKRLFWLMHADLRLRALDCCCLIHSQHRSKGSDLTTEPSHWTSVKGCVNSFSSVLHITISPSTRLSPTLGGSQLNLWRGQRLRPAPGWKTYCFSKRGGCAGNCKKKRTPVGHHRETLSPTLRSWRSRDLQSGVSCVDMTHTVPEVKEHILTCSTLQPERGNGFSVIER